MSLEKILRLDKKLGVKFKQVFLLLNMSFEFPFEIIYLVIKKGKSFWLNGDGRKNLLTMNPMEEQITKMNIISDNMKYPIDNKKNLCQHNKLHPLTYRRVK